jgi:predicted flap endonuclease-1-like 5' DNA nuclease
MFQDIFQGPGNATYFDHTWEILIMLLIAFLLGLLLGYILWYRWRKMYLELQEDYNRLKALHTDLEKDHASLRYKADELEKENKNLHSKVMSLEAEVAAWKAKYAKCESELAAAIASPSVSAATRGVTAIGAVEAAPPPKPDDLKIVEGVGPKIETLLNDAGIWTWRQLSETHVETLRKILDQAGPNYRIADPGTWPRQAGLAAEGKWDELKEYQDFLSGGRNPDDVG